MGKGFWEHMVADSTSWVQDSNERLKEYLEGSLSKAGLESFVTVMPRRDGYRIYAGEKPDAPFAYVDVYLDGNALVVEGSSKRHLSEQEMGDLARFLGISGSEAGEKLNRFRKFIDALQKHAGEDVDKLDDLKVSDACGKAAKGQKIGEDAPKATVSDDLGASAEVYLVHDGDMSFGDAADIISSFNTDYSLEDGLLWASEKWVDPLDSATEVNLALAAGILGIANGNDIVASDLYDSLSDDNVYEKLAVKDLVVQVYTSDHREYHEFIYKDPSHELLRKVVRTVLFFSEARDNYKDTYEGLKKILPAAQISDSVSVNFKNSKGGSVVRQISGERVGKPVGKARPVMDSKLDGQKVGKPAPKAKVRDFAAAPESALVPFQNAWAKLQSNSKLPKVKTSINYMGDLIPVELERKGADAVDVYVNGKSVGSYDLKKDSADYVFNAIIGRDDTTVGDRVDNGLSKTSDAAGNSGIEMLKLLSHLLLNDIDYTLQDDGSVDVDIPIGSGSDGSIAITLSGNAPDLNSALKGTVTNANISVSVNGSGVRSWVVSSLDASKLKDVLLDLHALSGSSSATVDEAIAILDVAYEDFAKSAVADAVEGTFAPQTKVRIKSLLTTDPYGHSGDAGVVLGRLDVDPDTVVVLFESGVPVALYDIDAIALDGTPAKTKDAAPAPFAKVKEGLELFVPLAITAHGGSVGADSVTITEGAAGRISVGLAADLGDTEVSAAAAALDNVARVLGYAASEEADGRTFLLTPLRVLDSVEDAASLVASLESDSSIENQRRVADIMLKNDMHVLKDGRKEIMVIANADTDIPLFSFKQHAWMNIHDKALDSGDAFGVYNLKERRWFLAPEDVYAARWGFEDAAKRYASKEDAEAALNEVAELQPGTAKSAFVVKPLGRVSDSEKRSDFVFPADSSDVNDGKGHFPLNSLRRARAAIAYANKYQELPTWYSGDLDLKGFVDKIVSEVKKQYPSIEISPESYIPAPDQK